MAKSSQVFSSLLLIAVITTAILLSNYPSWVDAEDDICPYQCKDSITEPVCGDKDGQKITYRNKCWLECRGYYINLQISENSSILLNLTKLT